MDDLASVAQQLEQLATVFDEEAKKIIANGIQDTAKVVVESAIRSSVGDLSMSGWRRGSPIPLSSHTGIEKAGIVVRPGTVDRVWARGLGPMRVLEQGRNHGGASGLHGPGIVRNDTKNYSAGETARTKSGRVKKVKAWAAKRWNGTTVGKGTWSKALDGLERQVPQAAQEALFKDSVRKLFGA